MLSKLNIHFSNIPRKLLITIAFLWIAVIGVAIYLFIYSQKVIALYNEVSQLDTQVAELVMKAGGGKKNTTLSEQEIEEFNQTAAKLVPAEESYFSLINALEQLSKETGFVLSDYNIDLTSGGENKVAITVNGTGDIEDFFNFLENYNFAGGRLVTVEQFDIPFQDQESYSLVLNFYNNVGGSAQPKEKPTSFDPNIVPEVQATSVLSPDDIAFVRNVLEKAK